MIRLFIICCLIFPTAASAQDGLKPYKLTGRLKDFPDSTRPVKFYISYQTDGRMYRDSAEVHNGKFVLRGSVKEPVIADLSAVAADTSNEVTRWYSLLVYMIYIEPGNQKITASKRLHTTAFTAKRSRSNADFIALSRQYEDLLSDIQPHYDRILAYRKSGDRDLEKAEQHLADSLTRSGRTEIFEGFVEKHPSSPVALYAFQRATRGSGDAGRNEALFDLIAPSVKELDAGKKMATNIEQGRVIGIGKSAPEFTQDDTLGNPVSLSSFRGNYVLVDFWASWCVPCRAENPNLIKTYDRYSGRNFRVISISLDRKADRDKWMKAIRDDKLTWTQLSDLQYWNNAVARQYGIEFIPQNLLIDPQGMIIGRNLKGDALDNALKLAFAEKKPF